MEDLSFSNVDRFILQSIDHHSVVMHVGRIKIMFSWTVASLQIAEVIHILTNPAEFNFKAQDLWGCFPLLPFWSLKVN